MGTLRVWEINTTYFEGDSAFSYLIVSIQKLHNAFPPSEYQDDLCPILVSEANSWSVELMRLQRYLNIFNIRDYIRRPFSWTLFTLESTDWKRNSRDANLLDINMTTTNAIFSKGHSQGFPYH